MNFGALFAKKEKKGTKKHSYKTYSPNRTLPIFATLGNAPPQRTKIQILIQYKNKLFTKITIDRPSASKLTCDWLLTEAQKRLKEADLSNRFTSELSQIVALRTIPTNLALDYWLTIPTESMNVFREKVKLEALIYDFSPVKDTIKSIEASKKISLSDFEICGLLGKGAFARVYLARKKKDGKFYALKEIQKGLLDEHERLRLVKEKDNLMKVRNTNSIHLYHAFQTEEYCYLVTTYCPASDFMKVLDVVGALSEGEAKYYVLKVLQGLKTMHSLGILFRDLKIENLLLDLDGQVYFADFGLSKDVSDPSKLNYTFCGTPGLYAPEILKKEGYSFPVDYYNVGTLAYELVLRKPPHPNKLESKEILSKEVDIPSKLSPAFQDFLRKILEKNPEKRLGKDGIDEIIAHPWLKDVQTVPPFKFSVFIINRLVKKIEPSIEKEMTLKKKTIMEDERKQLLFKRTVSSFSLYSQGSSEDSEQGSHHEHQGNRVPKLTDNTALFLSDLDMTEIKTKEKKGSQEIVLGDLKSTRKKIYDYEKREVDEFDTGDDQTGPHMLEQYELNVAEKLISRHQQDF